MTKKPMPQQPAGHNSGQNPKAIDQLLRRAAQLEAILPAPAVDPKFKEKTPEQARALIKSLPDIVPGQ